MFLALLSPMLPACTSARNTLGTNSSSCYLALPVAEDAVHDRGTFAGVRLVTARDLARNVHALGVLKARAGGHLQDVCVVEFRGPFRLDQVKSPLGQVPPGGVGRYAIVVVAHTSNRLLATFVRAKEPERFRKLVAARMNAPRTR